jgi:hypothetical protein
MLRLKNGTKKFGISILFVVTLMLTISIVSIDVFAKNNSNTTTSKSAVISSLQKTSESTNKIVQQGTQAVNYSQEDLQNYIKQNPEEFDKNNAANILTDYMKSKNLDHLTAESNN